MLKIIFIESTGKKHEIEAAEGETVMQAALNNLVPGIVGDCGGFLNCATCHGYVDEVWFEKLPPASPDEKGMLDCAIEKNESSRLTCQITMSADLDGIVIRIPERQT